MKNLLTTLTTALILLTGCTARAPRPEADLPEPLQRAEALMYPHPDSALSILQAMPVPADEHLCATWALFTTQARYKLDQPQTDSLIRIALPHFLKHDDPQRCALALYYRAALYNEDKQVEQAQEFYLKAAEEVEKTEDYQLAHLIYAGLWSVYGYRNLNDYALEAAQKALEYAEKANNRKQQIASYAYMARTYTKMKRNEDVISSYKKGLAIAEEIGDYTKQMGISSELAARYEDMGDYKSALSHIKKSLDITSRINVSKSDKTMYLVAGRIYNSLNQSDSAIYYLKKALSTPNIYTKEGAHTELFYLLKGKKNFEEAASHLEKAWVFHDSISQIDKSKALIEMQEKYDQQKVIIEKNKVQMQRDVAVRNGLCAALVLTLVIVGTVYTYRRRLRRSHEQLAAYVRRQEENEAVIRHNEELIEALRRRIAEGAGAREQLEEQQCALDALHRSTAALRAENLALQRRIESYPSAAEVERLRADASRLHRLEERERRLTAHLAETDPLVCALRAKPRFLTPADWQHLEVLANRIYPDFTLRLRTHCPNLTELDVQLCLLLKLRFTPVAIATLTAVSPSSFTVQKSRLKKRMAQSQPELFGVGQTLDMVLWEY